MDEIVKSLIGIPKPLQHRVMIEGAYTEELARDPKKMAMHLGLPVKLLHRWRRREDFGKVTGWLSHPITRDEYLCLLIICNFVWGLDETLRMQLSRMAVAKRQSLVNECEMEWIERRVYRDVLRHKMLGGRKHLKYYDYRKNFENFYQNGVKQLSYAIFGRMKKSANYQYSKARKEGAGTVELLAKSVGLEMRDGKIVRPRVETPNLQPTVHGDHNVPEEMILLAEAISADQTAVDPACPPPSETMPEDDTADQVREWNNLEYYATWLQGQHDKERDPPQPA